MIDYKTLRTGEQRRARNGLIMTIVYYEHDSDIWVQFSDGSFAGKNNYANFKQGSIEHPDDTPQMQAILRLGETKRMNNGQLATITKYDRATNIEVTFQNGLVIKHCRYRNFLLGAISGNRSKPKIKTDKIDQKAIMHCGLACTITGFNTATDIEVTFDCGEVLKHVTYHQFQRKYLLPREYLRRQKLGEHHLQHCGRICTIIKFNTFKDIDVEFEDDHTIITSREYRDFLNGGINPKGSAYWYNGSFNELYCALFFEKNAIQKI